MEPGKSKPLIPETISATAPDLYSVRATDDQQGPPARMIDCERNGVIAAEGAWSPQDFETLHLGLRTAKITRFMSPTADIAGLCTVADNLIHDAEQYGIQLLTCRVGSDDCAALSAIQRSGFETVECLLTLERRLDTPAAIPDGVEFAHPEDAEICAQIARQAFSYDRFHSDPAVSNAGADNLKAAWAENACRSRADTVFIIRENERIVGFNACLLTEDQSVIDLIAIAPIAQGRGYGTRLVQAAVSYYTDKTSRLYVGTQSRNLGSLAMYQRCGFRVSASALTLHAHLSRQDK